MSGTSCCICAQKDEQIKYLRAIIALNALDGKNNENGLSDQPKMETVELKQQIKLMQQQLYVMRADVQYLNHEVQSIFAWISKLITIFLRSCGRLGESTASAVIDSASKVSSSLVRLAYLNTP